MAVAAESRLLRGLRSPGPTASKARILVPVPLLSLTGQHWVHGIQGRGIPQRQEAPNFRAPCALCAWGTAAPGGYFPGAFSLTKEPVTGLNPSRPLGSLLVAPSRHPEGHLTITAT